ncbi:lysozyme [Sphingomonas paeninsulae]|nr:glycoside hydrolase family protein [Sphingomonas paeninsulae]
MTDNPILPMAEPKKAVSKPSAVALAIAAAVAISVPITSGWEGTRLDPYWDKLAKVETVCLGETRVAMRHYTLAQCNAMLADAQAHTYGPEVLKCAPEIMNNRYIFAASIDAAYNAGSGAFCRSPMRAAFNARQWRKGCDAFIGWRATAQGVPVRGLARRRSGTPKSEHELCMKGLPNG